MNTKLGTVLALLILIIIGLYYFQNQNSMDENTKKVEYVEDLTAKQETQEKPMSQKELSTQVEKEQQEEELNKVEPVVTQKDIKGVGIIIQGKDIKKVKPIAEKKRVEIPKITMVEKETPKEPAKDILIPNGFKAATAEEILEISSKELKLENYTEIYDENGLNVYIDNYLSKNVKKKNIVNMLRKIKKYIQDSTVIIKKDKDFNVYLEVMEYKNEELMKLDDAYVKSNHIYHFGSNKTEIENKSDVKLFLSDLDVAIKEGDAKNLVLVGYTDSVGKKEYNTFLAYKRAHSLSDKLSKHDVGIKYIVKGESNPIATNKTAEGRALNRRIEIFLGF